MKIVILSFKIYSLICTWHIFTYTLIIICCLLQTWDRLLYAASLSINVNKYACLKITLVTYYCMRYSFFLLSYFHFGLYFELDRSEPFANSLNFCYYVNVWKILKCRRITYTNLNHYDSSHSMKHKNLKRNVFEKFVEVCDKKN